MDDSWNLPPARSQRACHPNNYFIPLLLSLPRFTNTAVTIIRVSMSESEGVPSSKQDSEPRMQNPSPLLARKEQDRARRAAEAEPGTKNQMVKFVVVGVVGCSRLLWSRGTN